MYISFCHSSKQNVDIVIGVTATIIHIFLKTKKIHIIPYCGMLKSFNGPFSFFHLIFIWNVCRWSVVLYFHCYCCWFTIVLSFLLFLFIRSVFFLFTSSTKISLSVYLLSIDIITICYTLYDKFFITKICENKIQMLKQFEVGKTNRTTHGWQWEWNEVKENRTRISSTVCEARKYLKYLKFFLAHCYICVWQHFLRFKS